MTMTVTNVLDNALRIAIRQSLPALWQAHYVKDKLVMGHPGLVVEPVPMMTRDDVILDMPLAKVSGKGLFVKELEVTLLKNRADIVVHSMKDVPVGFPQGLGLVTIRERGDSRDASVSSNYDSLDALPAGSIVGTSNLRRQRQLTGRRPDLAIRSLHGNVGTRLSKLNNGEYDVIILAVAGLRRLGLEPRICAALPPEISPPVARQGVVGTKRRLDDTRTRELFTALNHHETALCVTAERVANTRLEGGCQVPIGNYVELIDGEIWLRAPVGAPDGSQIIYGERHDTPQSAEQTGISLAEELPDNGACEILVEVYNGDASTRVPWSPARLPLEKS